MSVYGVRCFQETGWKGGSIMKIPKNGMWILLFGSVWGISELIGGGALYKWDIPDASVWLSVGALFILGIARGMVNQPGSSTLMGGIAALFKLAYTQPFVCHLLGILTLGLAFDAGATLLLKGERKISFRLPVTGALSAYGGYAGFALLITFVIRYTYWVAGGWTKVLHHIFLSGTYAALGALVAVPLGFWMGLNTHLLTERSPRWAYGWGIGLLTALWILGGVFG